MNTAKKMIVLVVAILVLALSIWFAIHFYFVWGNGVKAGNLNQVVYKGWIWKTYEGRIIMSGFSNSTSDKKLGLSSNQFEFSVDKKAIGYRENGSTYFIADSLMRCSGKNVQLRYKEYRGALPWRGVQRYVVYDILKVSNSVPDTAIPIQTE